MVLFVNKCVTNNYVAVDYTQVQPALIILLDLHFAGLPKALGFSLANKQRM